MKSQDERQVLVTDLRFAADFFAASDEGAKWLGLPSLLLAAAQELADLTAHIDEGCRLMEQLLALLPEDDDE